MKRISLLRHTEAADRSASVADYDRPLTARGRADAALMGAFLAKRKRRPDLALCSPSARTRETLDGVCAAIAETPHAVFNEALYGAAPAQMLAVIHGVAGAFRHILIVGHNPGLREFALALADGADGRPMRRLERKFPKGALAQIDADVGAWGELAFAGGRLVAYATPKDLREV